MFSKECIEKMIKETESFLKMLKDMLNEEEQVIASFEGLGVTNSNKDLPAVVLTNGDNEFKIIHNLPNTICLGRLVQQVTEFFKTCSKATLVIPNDGTLLSCVKYIKGDLKDDDYSVLTSVVEVSLYVRERYNSDEFNHLHKDKK